MTGPLPAPDGTVVTDAPVATDAPIAPNAARRRVVALGAGAAPLCDRLRAALAAAEGETDGGPVDIEAVDAPDGLLRALHEGPVAAVLAAALPAGLGVAQLAALVEDARPGVPLVVVHRGADPLPPHRLLAAGAHAAVPADVSGADLAAVLATVDGRARALADARAEAAARGSWIHTKGQQIQAFREALLELDHELTTPVAVLQGYCANLADGLAGPVTDAQREQLGRMATAVDLVAAVVARFRRALPDEKDVRDALDHDARSRRRERVRVPELVREAIALFAGPARDKGITLAADLDPGCQPVWGDRVRLLQLLANLLANAVRHAPRGGRVDVSAHLRAAPGERSACRVVVRDDGPGVAEDDRWKIWFSGWSGDPDRRGMGLAICAEIAAEHGTTVALTSGPGEGAAFTIDLPRDPRARRARARVEPGQEG